MKTKAKQLLSDISEYLKELKISHTECDDPYYSCQMTEDHKNFTGKEDDDVICTCGADYYNEKIDLIIKKIEKFITENHTENRN